MFLWDIVGVAVLRRRKGNRKLFLQSLFWKAVKDDEQLDKTGSFYDVARRHFGAKVSSRPGSSELSKAELLDLINQRYNEAGKEFPETKKLDSFYTSPKWFVLRYKVLAAYGPVCMCCNATDCIIHVDHIKPKSKYPSLALNFNNLQVLCEACNLGKSNMDETDWRPEWAKLKYPLPIGLVRYIRQKQEGMI